MTPTKEVKFIYNVVHCEDVAFVEYMTSLKGIEVGIDELLEDLTSVRILIGHDLLTNNDNKLDDRRS